MKSSPYKTIPPDCPIVNNKTGNTRDFPPIFDFSTTQNGQDGHTPDKRNHNTGTPGGPVDITSLLMEVAQLRAENAQLRAENAQFWQEQQWIEALLRVDHSVLSASHKATLLAIYRDLPNHGTDPQGWRQIKTHQLVKATGSSQDTVLSAIERAKHLGLVEKRKRRVDQGDGNYTTDFFLKDLPALYTPARYQEMVQGELLRKHGGKQKPRCVNCGSENLDRHEWQHCRSCGYDHFVPLFDDPPQNRQFANTDDQEEQNPQFADIVDADPEEHSADCNVGKLPTFPTPPQYPQVANIEETHLTVDTLCLDVVPLPAHLELQAIPQWVCWRAEPDKKGKPAKVPYNALTGNKADVSKLADCATYVQVCARFERSQSWAMPYTGVGFVFHKNGIVGIDRDKNLDPLIGSYTELSYSETGIHTFARGNIPAGRRRNGIELYDTGRFFAWTGKHVPGTPGAIMDCQAAIDALYAELAPPVAEPLPLRNDNSSYSRSADGEILEKARNARNGAKFRALYDQGNWSSYPSQSEADQALCRMLAYWTDGNVSTIERLFVGSGLMREKWDRDDYRERTLAAALGWQVSA